MTGIHLCFVVSTQFNNLLPEQNPTRYSDEQISTHALVSSLKEGGLGYRRIAHELNSRGLTTHTGQKWSSAYVYAVLKRYTERIQRQIFRNEKYPLEYSKMWVE
mgnify:FL=1